MKKKLYRVREGKMIAGVCGGIAKYFGIDPMIVRVFWAALSLAHGIGIVAYILLHALVPEEPLVQ